MKNKNGPITSKEEIRQNADNKIDEDFKGYPSGPANDETIKPETKEENKVADLENKDGEKMIYKKNKVNEQDSDHIQLRGNNNS